MAESEWWTSPSEAARRLEALSTYWNTLRNTALGRSTQPLVSDDLADDVAAEHLAYHAWRDSIVPGLRVGPITWADELRDWTRRANEMRARIAQQLDVELPAPQTEWQDRAIESVAEIATRQAVTLAAVGFGVLYLISRARR